jgi:hypothetical protein
MKDLKNNCMICGADLVYYDVPRKMECQICHQEFETTAACASDHYICDKCHSERGIELIVQICKHIQSKNPIEIMGHLMRQEAIHMHGPEHHVLVGAALLAGYHNSGGELDLETAIDEMVRRGSQVPGGVCGFWGCCGAAISTGIFCSIITGSTPLKEEVWSLSNELTSKTLEKIAQNGGPRCCKRDSFIAATVAVAFVKERLGVEMELPEKIICEFSSLNKQCRKEKCLFYQKE